MSKNYAQKYLKFITKVSSDNHKSEPWKNILHISVGMNVPSLKRKNRGLINADASSKIKEICSFPKTSANVPELRAMTCQLLQTSLS